MKPMVTTLYNGKLPLALADPNGIFTWCPHLNLIFIAMNKMSIWCYRMNGERIYSINNKSIVKHIAFYREYFCLSGTDNLIKIYDSNNGQLVKVLPQEFDGVEFVGWNGTEYRVLVSMPMVYDLVSELDYLVVSDGKRMAITFNQLLTVDWECKMSVQQQLNGDLFNQVYVAGDKLVRVRFVVDNQKLYTEQIIKVCQLISLLEYGEQHIQKIKGLVVPFLLAMDRYMSNLESECGDLAQYLSDLVVSNIIPEFSKDFWLNQYGERGHKRMVKLAGVYESCVKDTYQHLVSTTERVISIVGELIGVSKWEQGLLATTELEALLDQAKLQLKFYYRFIWDLQTERQQVSQFLVWTKSIIDMLNDQECDIAYSTTDVLCFINGALTKSVMLKYFDIKGVPETPMTNISMDLTTIGEYHRSRVEVEVLQNISLPSVYTNLKLAQWEEVVVTYQQGNALVIANVDGVVSTVQDVYSYQHRQTDLVALTSKSLLIIDSSSCIPIALPETLFQPTKLILNQEYGVLLDSTRQHYSIFRM